MAERMRISGKRNRAFTVWSGFTTGEKKAFTTNMTVGCVTAMVGFFAYSHIKMEAARQSALSKISEMQLEDTSPLLKTQIRRASKEEAV
jgi:hypothetical protein